MKIRDIVKLMIKEAPEEDSPEADPSPEDVPSNVDVMLQRFKILNPVLNDLLGTDPKTINNIVSNIEMVVFKPSTFKIVFANGNEMMLKYTPMPTGVNGVQKSDFKPKDFFQCLIAGKKYDLQNVSQYGQAVDYISKALTQGPITKAADQNTGGGESPEEQGTAGSNIDNNGGQDNKAPDEKQS